MKKILLSTLLFCALIIIISCDNEVQEDSINETLSEKQLIHIGDDLVEIEFITNVDGEVIEISLNEKDAKIIEDFKESYPNSIYFIEKDEVRVFKNDNDLGSYLGKNFVNKHNEIFTGNSIDANNFSPLLENSFDWPSIKLYKEKYFNNLVYSRSFNGYLEVSYNTLNNLNLNDETSSFEVFPTTYNLDARFFEHNFSGRSIYVRAYVGYPVRFSDLSTITMGSWWWNNWNNEISSFSIIRS